MSNLFGNLSKSSSNSNMSRMEHDLKMLEENTSKFENQLNVSIDTLEQYIKNWKKTKQNIKDIYQIGTFKFRSTYKIKVLENTHSIGLDTETIELLNPRDIKLLRDQSYKILHIGAIEVAVKPLTWIGLNKPICVCLRDARHNNFDDSLLGVMESNMAHDPIYFNYFPDLELSCIDDMAIHKALTLNVQTKGYDMDPRAKNILILYRIYYKAMTTSVYAKCLLKSPKGKTFLFQANEEHSSVMTLKEIL